MNKSNQVNLTDMLESKVDGKYFLSGDELKQASNHIPNFNHDTHRIRRLTETEIEIFKDLNK